MTLLTEVYQRPLDPGYREAARRRAAGEPPVTGVRKWFGLVAAVALGLLLTAATLELRQPTAGAVRARALLEQQIATQQERATSAKAQIRSTTAQLAAAQDAALSEEDPTLLAELRRDAAPSGVSAVSGPGLRMVLKDGPAEDGAAQPDAAHRVQDVDLQVVVNGLWEAGAEAISINGDRLTSLTAIRSAGSAVLVDQQGLSSPYTIDAIGDAGTMQSRFAASSAGEHLATLRATYGIGVQVSSRPTLALAGTGDVALQFASPVPTPSATPAVAPSVPEGSGS